ncbi:hypothetical protein U1Q18_006469 [Sarracenia purpurea var. burkii]
MGVVFSEIAAPATPAGASKSRRNQNPNQKSTVEFAFCNFSDPLPVIYSQPTRICTSPHQNPSSSEQVTSNSSQIHRLDRRRVSSSLPVSRPGVTVISGFVLGFAVRSPVSRPGFLLPGSRPRVSSSLPVSQPGVAVVSGFVLGFAVRLRDLGSSSLIRDLG